MAVRVFRRALTGAVLALAGAILASATATAQVPGENKTFHDWVAGCDNTKSCAAVSLPAEGADLIGFLKLERMGGPDAAAALFLKLQGEKLAAPPSVDISLDGAPFPSAGRSAAATLADGETAIIAFSEADGAALIAAARSASKLSAVMQGKTYAVSLSGAVAAMRWIDAKQGRTGTVTALIDKGAQPAGAVPAAPALPVVKARPGPARQVDAKAAALLAAALRRHLKATEPDACLDIEPAMPDRDRAWRLDATRRLVGLACLMSAYNSATGFWIVTGDAVARARQVEFSDGPADLLPNAHYEPKTGRLDTFDKGRGVGDCGINKHYTWTGRGFTLTGYAIMDACRVVPWDDWLVLYSSKVKIAK